MLKLFRKIRQMLLDENKIGSYFKYAIGEILLVVIGILIALQVDNYREAQLTEGKETVFLYGLRSYLLLETRKENLIYLKNQIKVNQ